VDVFRGATIAVMIVVNNPGSWAHVFAPLRHAAWEGCTVADLVFPGFLFVVGVSIALALLPRVQHAGPSASLALKVVRRAAILFALGLGLAAFPSVELGALRIPGVLQRIAVCYAAVAFIAMARSPRIEYSLIAAILASYAGLAALEAGQAPAGLLSARVDRLVFGRHALGGAIAGPDPEGVLSTLPALATTLIGLTVGRAMMSVPDASDRAPRFDREMLGGGAALVLLGLGAATMGPPLNKTLWSSSFVLFTAGLACLALTELDRRLRRHPPGALARMCAAFGVNALPVFVGSGLIARLMAQPIAAGPSAQQRCFEWLHGAIASAPMASLIYALAWLGVWTWVVLGLRRRGIVLKV
jgi:predicted acyltransferase